VDAIEDLLAFCVEKRDTAAATAAAEILGAIADAEILRSPDGQPRELARALRHPDRRLRMAAAEAIMRIDPQTAFAGASFVPETFGYVAGTVGTRKALVAHPRVAEAQTLVGLLSQIGFDADAASTGREAFRRAAGQPDYELALFSDALDYPNANETVQMFRRDPRTAELPIGLMARRENLVKAMQAAELDSLLIAFPRLHDREGVSYQTTRLLQAAGHDYTGFDERLDQASAALGHLIHLAKSPDTYPFYDLHRQRQAAEAALGTPVLAVKAAELLGLLGSPQAQRSLITMASQNARPLAERQAAARGFDTAVRQHGLLLTRSEILEQYERYNRSATLDADTQQVLGSLLDIIERPSKEAAAREADSAATDAGDS
jgi:hypothetical protein